MQEAILRGELDVAEPIPRHRAEAGGQNRCELKIGRRAIVEIDAVCPAVPPSVCVPLVKA